MRLQRGQDHALRGHRCWFVGPGVESEFYCEARLGKGRHRSIFRLVDVIRLAIQEGHLGRSLRCRWEDGRKVRLESGRAPAETEGRWHGPGPELEGVKEVESMELGDCGGTGIAGKERVGMTLGFLRQAGGWLRVKLSM